MTILVSACLIGVDCKYSGGNNYSPEVISYLVDKKWIPICPEQLGGLSTPRLAAEIVGGDGTGVLTGQCQVINKKGEDVTAAFYKGAVETLKLAQLVEADTAILKAYSPSCGSREVYDGTFQDQRISGLGVTVALLHKHGIKVLSEKDLQGSKS